MISKRLNRIADLVLRDKIVFDVGSDHALLPCYLIKHDIAKKVYAGDNKVGPLNSAISNIKAYGYEDKIYPILSDGLEKADDDVEVVIIAGMGYYTVESILNNANLNKYEQIIVQINKNSHLLRKYISEHNYTILDEDVVYDEFYYEIVVFNTNYHESYTNKEIEFGPVLLKKRSETFIEYMNYRAKQIKKIIEQAKLEDNPKLIELSKIEEIIKDA